MKTAAQALTSEQQLAISHFTGPALVLAGPGSGKTRVITERVNYLINRREVPPQKILVTTFTEKAATELKHRLFKGLGTDAEYIHVSTIHSLCKTILEDCFEYHPFGSRFTVLDAETQSLLVEANIGRLRLGGPRGWREIVIKAAGFNGNPEDTVCVLYNFLTDNLIDTGRLRAELDASDRLTHDMERLLDSYEIYNDILKEEKLIDFSHLQSLVYGLLYENKEVFAKLQDRFEFIMVDEYQDTSPLQDLIFRGLAGKNSNIFVVGDANQSIYSFRGADTHNFLSFPGHFKNTREYSLCTNFRSTELLVQAANKIMEGRIKKQLQAHRRKGNRIILIKGENRHDAAQGLVDYLKHLTGKRETAYGDIAFLCRKKRIMEPYIIALRESGIPFVATDEGRFTEREEIKAYLKLFNYVTQNQELEGKFREWSWWNTEMFKGGVSGLSARTIGILDEAARDFDIASLRSPAECKKHGITDHNDIKKLVRLNELRNDAPLQSSLEIFYGLFRLTGYLGRLFNEDSTQNREKLYNLACLTRIVDNYEKTIKRPSAQRFLKHIYYRSRNNSYKQYSLETENTVKVMTVHKAKGLEFPVVAVCSLIDGDFPGRFRENDEVCGVPIPPKFRLHNTCTPDEEDHYNEELRLFYVALTRAQDLLLITESDHKETQKAEPSAFKELIRDYITQEISNEVEVKEKYTLPNIVPHISYTSMNTYLDCPFRYRINYEYGFISPPSFIQKQGIIAHNVLQRINNDLKNKKKLTREMIAGYYELYEMPLPDVKKEREWFKQTIIENCWQYYRMALKEWKEIAAIEKPFTFIGEDIIVYGRVDLVVVDKSGQTLLVDFKARTKEGIESTMVHDQLNFYTYCLKDKSITAMLAYTLLDNEKIILSYDEKRSHEAISRLCAGLKNRDFHPDKNSQFCRSGKCGYKFICEDLPNG
jgi:DNA helicase-2/ATP-dependent DNA helicase PcrA